MSDKANRKLRILSDGKYIDFDDASDVWFDGVEIHMNRGGSADIMIRPEHQVITSIEVPYETKHSKQEQSHDRPKRQRRQKRV